MTSESLVCRRDTWKRRWVCIGAALVIVLAAAAKEATAQSFTSGSDGSDGAYMPSGPPGTVVIFDPTKFSGTQVGANIFNFTTIVIPESVTVRFSGDVLNSPVFWLAQEDVDIQGFLDLRGANAASSTSEAFDRVPSAPGSGGYRGGVGGNSVQAPLPGSGPGGGVAGAVDNGGVGAGGTFKGNQFLIPLVGGSGGGGGLSDYGGFCSGGGGGGGALLVASSTQITVGGSGIYVRGGVEGSFCTGPGGKGAGGGGGSGGAIRLVSNTIAGGGPLVADGGSATWGNSGGPGVVRLEANTIAYGGPVFGMLSRSTPFPLLLPTAGPPSAKVISIGGTEIAPDPSTFPDLTINTTSPLPVVIQTHNIPATATINLTILNQNGVADAVLQAPPLSNCDSENFCTTTVNVVFPFGASNGLTKVTWTQ